jgi:hypothetical protein
MDLVERYLQAVRFWLPKQQKQDITAELSEDLYSEIEEKESSLGRKLTRQEVEAILKQRGRPVLVANRYQPQQYLIGPVLFPIYSFVLKMVALCYLIPWVLVWIGLMTYSPSYRAEHGNWFEAMGSAWSGLWTAGFVAIGTVTLVFAILERVQSQSHFLENWDPGKLPAVRSPNKIPRSASLIEVVMTYVFGIVWWVSYLWSPLIVNRPDLKILLTPAWHYFFWGFLAVSIVNVGISATNLARPYWTTQRATLRLSTNLVGSALFCALVKVNILAEINVRSVDPARMVQITGAINMWTERMLPVAILIGAAVLAGDLYRLYRIRRTGAPSDLAAALI